MNIGAHEALVDFIEDGSYYIVETIKDTCDFEKLSSVEKFLTENFLLPYWVGEEDKAPKLENHVWADDLDSDVISAKIKILQNKKVAANVKLSTTGVSPWFKSIMSTGTASTITNYLV